jgi:DNA-binding response OmpR family regulator
MSRKILIIDDEKWFFNPFLEHLEADNIAYDYCEDGSKGLAKLETDDFSAVVLDMKVSLGERLAHMLGQDVPGILIFKEIKKIKPNIPVICWTVLSDEEIKKKVRDLGGTYISKAGSDSEFIDEIKRHLKECRQEKQ